MAETGAIEAATELIDAIDRLPKGTEDDAAYQAFRRNAEEAVPGMDAALAVARMPLELSVAVVGVFRSGKSTILNALLGARILPAAHSATTATVTEISFREAGFEAEVCYLATDDASLKEAREKLERILIGTELDVLATLRDPRSPAKA